MIFLLTSYYGKQEVHSISQHWELLTSKP